jgi:cytochrome oxidase Cu insertion factor (SCO1/SenC/PrrC family)
LTPVRSAGTLGLEMRKALVWGSVLGVAVIAGVTISLALVRGSRAPAANVEAAAPIAAVATWRAGARRAPNFALADQHGKPLSLVSLRGHPVIVTFIDPVCRNLCPLEAKVLSKAAARLPLAQRPTIVSVSVNPGADIPANFKQDAVHWRLAPGWRWGLGSKAQLAGVWHSYGIEVEVVKKVVAGVTVRSVVHTEGSFVIDRTGHERALFLYPFTARDVEQTLRRL